MDDKENIPQRKRADFRVPPPTTAKKQRLRYGELDWEVFQDLIRRLVEIDSDVVDCRRYGRKGHQQEGIDLFARERISGEYIVYQCKNEKDFGPAKIKAAVSEFEQGDWFERASSFVLCTSDDLSSPERSDTVIEERERLKDMGKGFIVWDSEKLNDLLKPRHDIVAEFFGWGWVEVFNPPLVKADTVGLKNLPQFVEETRATVYVAPGGREAIISEEISLLQEYATSLETIQEDVNALINEALDEAKTYSDAGDLENAEGPLRRIVRFIKHFDNKQKGRYYNILCCIDIGRSRFEDAVNDIEKALESDTEIKYRLNKAICLVATEDKENMQAAKTLLDGIPEEERNISQYHYAEGNFNFAVGDYASAEGSFARAIELDNENYTAMINYAGTFLKRHEFEKFDGAIENVARFIERKDVSRGVKFRYHYSKGFRHLVELTSDRSIFTTEPETGTFVSGTLDFPPGIIERVETALIEFEKALEYTVSDFDRFNVFTNMSFCLITTKKYKEAKRILEGLLSEDLPAQIKRVVYANLGDVYRILGEFDDAVNNYRDAIEKLGPTYANRVFLALSLVGMGAPGTEIARRSSSDRNEGIKILEKLINEKPDDLFLKNNLGVIYLIEEKLSSAEELFKTIEEVAPTNLNMLKNLGSVYYNKGDYRKSFAYCWRCYWRIPEADRSREVGLTYMMAKALGQHAFSLKTVRQKDRAIEIIEGFISNVPDAGGRFDPGIILIRLYEHRADIESNELKRRGLLDKAIELAHQLEQIENLPPGVRTYLTYLTRRLNEKKTGIAGVA